MLFLTLVFLSALFIRIIIFNVKQHPAVDEIWAYLLTKASFTDIWYATLSELHTPLYFIALHGLSLIVPFEIDITFLRWISLFFGVASCFGIWYLASLVSGKRCGLIAFFLSLFLPSFIWSSVFARYYSILLLINILATIFFIRFVRTRKIINLALLTVTATAGMYTHYYFALVIFSFTFFLFIVKKYRNLLLQWLVAMAVVITLLIPELFYFFTLPKPEVVGLSNHLLKIPALLITNITSWELLVYLYYYGNPFFYVPVLTVLSITSILLFIYGFREMRREFRALFLSIIMIPPVLAIVISYAFKPILGLGALQIFSPYLLVVLANGIAADLKRTKLITIAFVVAVFGSLVFFFQASEDFYGSQREDMLVVLQEFRKGDIIVHSHLYSFLLGRYYLGDNINFGLIHTTSSTPYIEQALGYKLISIESISNHKGWIWYLKQPEDTPQEREIKAQLDNNFLLVKSKSFTRPKREYQIGSFTFFNVFLYVKKIM